jgi:hypothetical protein
VWLYHIFSRYLKRHSFRKNVIWHKIVFWVSLQLLSAALLILIRIQRDIITNVRTSSCKVPVIFFRVLRKLEFSRQVFIKVSNIKVPENPPSGSRIFPRGRTNGWTDRRTDRHTQTCRQTQTDGHTDGQTDTDGRTDRHRRTDGRTQTDGRTDTDRQADWQTDRQTDRHGRTDRQTHTDGRTDRRTDRQTDGRTDRQGQTDGQTDTTKLIITSRNFSNARK